LGAVLAVVGVALIVGGVIVVAVVVPGQKVFPSDVDTTRIYAVDYLTLLDAESMAFLHIAPGESEDLRVERNIFVEAVDGKKTLVRETQTLLNGDEVLAEQVKYHPLDRRTMEFLDEFPEAWAEHDGYWEREGLVIGWGIGVDKEDYTGWSDDTRTAVDLVYEGEQEHGDTDTYYFTSQLEPTQMDEAHIAVLGMPASLTLPQLAALANSIDVEGLELSMMAKLRLLDLLQKGVAEALGEGSDIPLTYYYDYFGEYWVEPTTGVLIDTHKHEHRAATLPAELIDYVHAQLEEEDLDASAANYLPLDIMDTLLPITVNEFEYNATAQSVEDARADADDAKSTLNTFGTVLPAILVVVGLIVSVVGVYLFLKNR
jgi:hypothetical protein